MIWVCWRGAMDYDLNLERILWKLCLGYVSSEERGDVGISGFRNKSRRENTVFEKQSCSLKSVPSDYSSRNKYSRMV